MYLHMLVTVTRTYRVRDGRRYCVAWACTEGSWHVCLSTNLNTLTNNSSLPRNSSLLQYIEHSLHCKDSLQLANLSNPVVSKLTLRERENNECGNFWQFLTKFLALMGWDCEWKLSDGLCVLLTDTKTFPECEIAWFKLLTSFGHKLIWPLFEGNSYVLAWVITVRPGT